MLTVANIVSILIVTGCILLLPGYWMAKFKIKPPERHEVERAKSRLGRLVIINYRWVKILSMSVIWISLVLLIITDSDYLVILSCVMLTSGGALYCVAMFWSVILVKSDSRGRRKF